MLRRHPESVLLTLSTFLLTIAAFTNPHVEFQPWGLPDYQPFTPAGYLLSGRYSPTIVSRWPAWNADHKTVKFDCRIPSTCDVTGFEFPHGSDIEYLSGVALWIGGIVGDDTLVSMSTASR